MRSWSGSACCRRIDRQTRCSAEKPREGSSQATVRSRRGTGERGASQRCGLRGAVSEVRSQRCRLRGAVSETRSQRCRLRGAVSEVPSQRCRLRDAVSETVSASAGMYLAAIQDMPTTDQLAAQLDRLTTFEPGPHPVVSLYLNLQPNEQGRDQFEPFIRNSFSGLIDTY